MQDLRAVDLTLEIICATQSGLPTPTMIPWNYHLVIIDLKDCFFTIPLDPEDEKRFVFSLPSLNFKEPMNRYQWNVLPQGMVNSPTLCQNFVAQAVLPVRKSFQIPTSSILWMTSCLRMQRKEDCCRRI